MPRQNHYQGMTLPEALIAFTEHHYDKQNRHISHDEAQLIARAAAVLERQRPAIPAFP